MTIILISARFNMTYEYYINQPMSMCERKIKYEYCYKSTIDKFIRS